MIILIFSSYSSNPAVSNYVGHHEKEVDGKALISYKHLVSSQIT